MRNLATGAISVLMTAAIAHAQPAPPPPMHPPIDYEAVNAEVRANMKALGLIAETPDAPQVFDRSSASPLIFPVRSSAQAEQFQSFYISNYVDHDETGPNNLRDFACGTRSYDVESGYDHQGTDISAGPFNWAAMDAEDLHVIAAAAGVIVGRNDGMYDRQCGGFAVTSEANYVIVLQDDGLTVYYWHFAEGSLTSKGLGERVEQGEYLGVVGSSGISTGPHLHFEMRHLVEQGGDGSVVDPYAGACNAGPSLWSHQHDHIAPAISQLTTHDAIPVDGPLCGFQEPNFRTVFQPGEFAYFGVNLADQLDGQRPYLTVIDPSGDVLRETFLPAPDFGLFANARWIASQLIPTDAETGEWRMRVDFFGETRERAFYVGEGPADGARLRAAVLPSSRAVVSGTTATAFATVINPSDVEARGCWLAPGAPFDGRIDFQTTDPATNAVTGETGRFFSVPAGGSTSLLVSLTPEADGLARSHDVRLRFRCQNADAAPITSGVNTILMSFDGDPGPDMIAVSAAPGGGVLALADENAAGAFAVSTANVGAGGSLTVRPRGLGDADGLRLRICETDPATALCLAPAAETVSRVFAADETATFSVFVRGLGAPAPFAPGANRVVFEAVDGDGIVRGSTSVAVRTD